MTHASRTKLILVVAMAGALALTLGLMARSGLTSASAGGGCAHADDQPNEASTSEFRASIICLIQTERLSRGKSELDINGKLRTVAADHNAVMLNQDCLEHQCAGEASLTKRLKQVGYLKGDSWAYAENIGYENTPREMIDKWMNSDYNRHNILANKFIDLGVGAGKGTPDPDKPDSNFVTYTAIFGDGG
jgi:uncharacterized protein YkwD